jgi:hypothetical protein
MRADAQNNTASPEEKINGIDPQEQKRALELFHKKLDAIGDEPLGEEFDKAINAGRCRAKKGEERLDFIRGTR